MREVACLGFRWPLEDNGMFQDQAGGIGSRQAAKAEALRLRLSGRACR